jgi:penicillin-binding protein 2
MQVRSRQTEMINRVAWLLRAVQVALVVVVIGYWSVQIKGGSTFRELAENNRLRRLRIEAPRGVIRDRHGRPLVENVPGYSLMIDRSRSADLPASLKFAADVLNETPEDLEAIVRRYQNLPLSRPIKLAAGLSLNEVTQLSASFYEHKEFEIDVDSRRLYRYGLHTAHLIGYLGEVSPAELARTEGFYKPGDRVGKRGIEQRYDPQLRGKNGAQLVVVDSRGQEVQELEKEPAQAGSDLTLTIDLALQQRAAELFEERGEAQTPEGEEPQALVGTVVALDPRNGDVLAMVAAPAYDPNIFTRRLNRQEWQDLIENPYHPLQNRAIQNAFPPGSVFKIVTALTALEKGVVDPNFSVFCPGYSIVYGNRFRCHKQGGHGTMNLRSAFKNSCNVYFHALGQRLQIDTLAESARKFGFGRLTGIDLEGERAGLVPDTRWAKERRKMPWYPGETISVVTGQGPILTTPMQIAVMLAEVANGGYRVAPRLYRDPAAPEPPREPIGFSPQNLALVREALWAVVNDGGTGNAAKVPGLDIAGKTGTAQVIRQETWTTNDQLAAEDRDHAWFASFAPVNDPKIVIVVFVEHGGGGSRAAAPIAKALYEKFFESDLAHRAAPAAAAP